MKIEYLDHMGSDIMVLNEARQSFNKRKPLDAPITEQDKSLLRFLARGFDQAGWDFLTDALIEAAKDEEAGLGGRETIQQIMWILRTKPQHFAPFAHPQVSFQLTAPLFMARQLWKAHIGAVGGDCGYAAWSEQSFRYRDAEGYYIPNITEWQVRPDNLKQGRSDQAADVPPHVHCTVDDMLHDNLVMYKTLREDYNVAPEQARLLLPAAAETTWTWTGSLMFFARVCYQRLDVDAQKDTQEFMKPLAEKMAELFPYSWETLTTGDIK